MVKPKMLKKGDKVAIVSLSKGLLGEPFIKHEEELLEKRLGELGLEYEYMPNARKGIEYLEKHPEARAEDLKKAFQDDSISMIWCAIGGEDTFRTLPYLMNEEFQTLLLSHPKIFMGFSDTTTNHLMLNKLGLTTYYGPALLPDVAELGPEIPPYTLNCIKNLFNNNRGILLKSSPIWYKSRSEFGPDQVGTPLTEVEEQKGIEFLGPKAKIKGELLGGCIEILYDAIAHERFPAEMEKIYDEFPIFPNPEDWTGKILVLETSEVQPEPKKYQKMIDAIEKIGVFDKIKGILVGKPMDEKYYDEYKAILCTISDKYQLPIAYNMNFGHGMPRMILPFGVVAELDSENITVKIDEPMFASDLEDKIREKLHESVDEKRYVHSLLVANQAKDLALFYGLDYEKAYIAGLTHDIAKRLKPEQEKYFVEKYNLDPELLNDDAKNYRHSEIGAVVAKEWFDLDDEICQSIEYHTIPRKDMTDFDKIIFISDKIGRNDLPDEWIPLKQMAYKDLNKAMVFFLEEQEKDLKRRGITPHPGSQEFLDSIA